jgi:hypothetical protein
MTTTITTTTTTITTRLALGAAFAALCFGAAACGDETTASPAASLNQAGSQQQSRISPRAAEQQDLARQRAEEADAKRSARGHETTEHPPGSFHADLQCRPGGHPTHGQIRCPATAPTQAPSTAPSAARPGSYKFPDLLP